MFRRAPGSLFRDEEGVTTVGMAVSLMLCLALMFSSAQLYQVHSASSEIQEVADVAALAAENEVAEFMIAAKLCDAAILSLTLLSGTLFGIGVVCACVPFLQGISADLITIAKKTVEARDRFADMAIEGLNKLQRLLPFLSAASAARVANANNASGALDASYFAVAILLPQEQRDIELDLGEGLSSIEDDVDGSIDDIRENSSKAEEKAKEANEAKQEAFEYDCGNAPAYCQYERASHLAGLSSFDNPLYNSVDAWSFSVALTRAQKYYKARQNEAFAGGSVADEASYHLRKRFYAYVSDELSKGYVHEAEEDFDCHFPKIFRNTAEFKATILYTEKRYPVTGAEGGKGTMHAYSGCPAAGEISSHDSISALDSGKYETCGTCGFVVSSMGNIASASTNIPNGFEHHYEKIRALSEQYKKAKRECDELKGKVKDDAAPIMDAIGTLVSEIGGKRIEVTPPGSDGAIALVVNAKENGTDEGFPSMFLSGGTTLGARAAVAGATLVEDDSDDNSTLITSLLDSFSTEGGAAVGAARIALDIWSGLLKAYERGLSAVISTVSNVLDSISLNTVSGLGAWAADALNGVIDAANLEPANLNALKPAILNTGHVASASSGSFAVMYTKAKAGALAASSPTSDVFTGLVSNAGAGLSQTIDNLEFTIATIEFPVGGVTLPIKLTLPQAAKDAANGLIDQCVNRLSAVIGRVFGYKAWQ